MEWKLVANIRDGEKEKNDDVGTRGEVNLSTTIFYNMMTFGKWLLLLLGSQRKIYVAKARNQFAHTKAANRFSKAISLLMSRAGEARTRERRRSESVPKWFIKFAQTPEKCFARESKRKIKAIFGSSRELRFHLFPNAPDFKWSLIVLNLQIFLVIVRRIFLVFRLAQLKTFNAIHYSTQWKLSKICASRRRRPGGFCALPNVIFN